MIANRAATDPVVSFDQAPSADYAALWHRYSQLFHRLPHQHFDTRDVGGNPLAASEQSNGRHPFPGRGRDDFLRSAIAFIGLFDRGFRRNFVFCALILVAVDFLALALLGAILPAK